MGPLALMWGIAVLVGLISGMVIYLHNRGKRDNRKPPIPAWRWALAIAIFAGILGTTILGRLDPNLHVCDTTTVTKLTSDSAEPSIETTRACGPPLDALHVALLMVPIVILVAPAISEFTIAGLFSAKIKNIAEKEAEDTTFQLVVSHVLGKDLRDAIVASETGEDLEDLPAQ